MKARGAGEPAAQRAVRPGLPTRIALTAQEAADYAMLLERAHALLPLLRERAPEAEKLRQAFIRETDPAKQKAIAETLHKRLWEVLPYIPVGQFDQLGGADGDEDLGGAGGFVVLVLEIFVEFIIFVVAHDKKM